MDLAHGPRAIQCNGCEKPGAYIYEWSGRIWTYDVVEDMVKGMVEGYI